MSEESGRDWAGELSAAERVEAVALTISEPRTANWIAAEADVAHETATKYLKRLTDDGKLRADTHGQQTTYASDPVGQYLMEMRELYENHSPDELAASLEAMNDQIRTWETTYDVDTPNELRASLSEATTREDERDRRHAAREWEHLRTRCRLVEDALRLHDRFPGEQNPVSV
jgi:Mn-dependent DtxR family transcriptional regulator